MAGDGGMGDDGDVGGDDGMGGGEGGNAGGGACEAKTTDVPTPLWGDKVLIRPPHGVELTEDSPAHAVARSSAGFVSACDASVMEMHIFTFDKQPKQTLQSFSDEIVNDFLPKNGYTDGSVKEKVVEQKDAVHVIVDYPANKGGPPASMYIASVERGDLRFAIMYRTSPDEIGMLKPTFKASAESLVLP
jgi:hypothetical protein